MDDPPIAVSLPQDKGFGSGDSQMESQAVDLQLKSIPDAISDVVVIAILDDASQAAGQGFESITSGTVQLSTRQSSDKSLSALCMHSLPWRLSAATCVELGRFTRQKDNSFSKFKFTSQGVRSDHKSMVNDLQNGLFLSKRAIEGVAVVLTPALWCLVIRNARIMCEMLELVSSTFGPAFEYSETQTPNHKPFLFVFRDGMQLIRTLRRTEADIHHAAIGGVMRCTRCRPMIVHASL